jgi:negative regulator of flagellin synthesis FlgM
MPIDGIKHDARPGPVLLEARSYRASGSNGKASSPQSDDVQISEYSREFFRIRQLVDAQPDVRLDRVNQLAKAIDSGTYDVKGEQIAEAIIEKNLIDFEA